VLPAAVTAGARIVTSVQVDEIVRRNGVATGVTAVAVGGGRLHVEAGRAVVQASGAIGTPLLLLDNRIGQGTVGRRLQCHPGIAVAGRFAEPVRAWHGATQGHEVTGLMGEGIKLEALGLDPAIIAHQVDRVGRGLVEEIAQLSHWATWAGAIRARAMGTVAPGRQAPKIRFALGPDDMRRVKRAVRALAELLFAAGAVEVTPGVAGFERHVTDPEAMSRFEAEGPDDPRAYSFAISHLFGTCRMGSDRRTSVVRPDFRHHAVDRLYIADASVFPTNLGVNPQVSIMSMASCCATSITNSTDEGSKPWRLHPFVVA
jgi:choline dehydrogenase-like flavoprotein